MPAKARMSRRPRSTSQTVSTGPKGSGTNRRSTGKKESSGASQNRNGSAFSGVKSCLPMSLRASAMGWITPWGPTS
jgi:hypothetical protein